MEAELQQWGSVSLRFWTAAGCGLSPTACLDGAIGHHALFSARWGAYERHGAPEKHAGGTQHPPKIAAH
jgi:hypothetical protein